MNSNNTLLSSEDARDQLLTALGVTDRSYYADKSPKEILKSIRRALGVSLQDIANAVGSYERAFRYESCAHSRYITGYVEALRPFIDTGLASGKLEPGSLKPTNIAEKIQRRAKPGTPAQHSIYPTYNVYSGEPCGYLYPIILENPLAENGTATSFRISIGMRLNKIEPEEVNLVAAVLAKHFESAGVHAHVCVREGEGVNCHVIVSPVLGNGNSPDVTTLTRETLKGLQTPDLERLQLGDAQYREAYRALISRKSASPALSV